MKKFTAIAMGIVLVLMVACKKENDNPSTVNHTGYWKGNAYLIHAAMLVKPDGSVRTYFGITGTDTAHAAYVGSGPYTISGNKIKAYGVSGSDTVFVETTLNQNDEMKGYLYTSFLNQITECKLVRQ